MAKFITRLMIGIIGAGVAAMLLLKMPLVARSIPRPVAHLLYGTPLLLPLVMAGALMIALFASYETRRPEE